MTPPPAMVPTKSRVVFTSLVTPDQPKAAEMAASPTPTPTMGRRLLQGNISANFSHAYVNIWTRLHLDNFDICTVLITFNISITSCAFKCGTLFNKAQAMNLKDACSHEATLL